jgi:hypothetical protein
MAELDKLQPEETEIETNPRDDGTNLDCLSPVAAATADDVGDRHHHHH